MGASELKLRELLANLAGNTLITVQGEYTGGYFFHGFVVELIGREEFFGVKNAYAENIAVHNNTLIIGVVQEGEF